MANSKTERRKKEHKVKAKYEIGQKISVRGSNNESFIIKYVDINHEGAIRYRLSDNGWYEESTLYVDMWKEPTVMKTGDIVKCISRDNEGDGTGAFAYRKDHYYLVKSIDDGNITTVLDSNGTKNNGWIVSKFKKVKTGTAMMFNDSSYMCIKDIEGLFTKGKIYQLKNSNGYLTTDGGNDRLISEKHKKHFRTILNTDWEKEDVEPDEESETTTDEEWDDIVEEATKEARLPPPELRDVDVKTECKMMKPMPVLLEGPVGTGKSTILLELAEELGLKYYASVLTDQTSASEFKGYKNAMNGEYVETEFRKAVEFGGMFVLEELNAATSNMPIIFNSLENSYFVFADKLVKVHPDFWLCATMNSITNAKDFGGRRIVDKSVRDRFHTIIVNGDIASRYKASTIIYAESVNTLLEEKGITDTVSPRDMRRFEHMLETTQVDKEVAIKKCLISNRLEVDEEWLRRLTKNKGEWK